MIFLTNIQSSEAFKIPFAKHTWFMSLLMFVGEFSSIFIYLFYRKRSKNNRLSIESNQTTLSKSSKKSRRRPLPTNFIFLITSTMDLLGSTLLILSLLYLPTSVSQMLVSIQLLFICIAGLLFLGHKIYRHQILSLVILIIGLFLIGLSAVINNNSVENSHINLFLGIILLIPGLLLAAGQKVFQEVWIKKYEINSYQLVGFEGLFGLLLTTILIIIFSFISCDFSENFKENVCFTDDKNNSHLEDPIFALKQIWDNKIIFILTLFFIIAAGFFNVAAVKVIEASNVITRGVVDTVKSFIIWLFFLIIHPIPGTKEEFHLLQLIGFILIVFANIIYSEIIEIPFFELNKYTKKNLEKNENIENQNNIPMTENFINGDYKTNSSLINDIDNEK